MSTNTSDPPRDDEMQEDDDDASMSNLIPMRHRRQAISAEAIADSDVKNYVKKVIPKDEQTMARLKKSAGKNFLFQHMEEDEKR